jgi:hypothetical protein
VHGQHRCDGHRDLVVDPTRRLDHARSDGSTGTTHRIGFGGRRRAGLATDQRKPEHDRNAYETGPAANHHGLIVDDALSAPYRQLGAYLRLRGALCGAFSLERSCESDHRE